GLAGIFLEDLVEGELRAPLLVAVSLMVVGFLLYWVDGRYPALRQYREIRLLDALWMGVAQAFAIVPGVSRSGATMLMGRYLGLNREAAARFSFLMSFPVILGAAAFEMRKLLDGGVVEISALHLAGGFLS